MQAGRACVGCGLNVTAGEAFCAECGTPCSQTQTPEVNPAGFTIADSASSSPGAVVMANPVPEYDQRNKTYLSQPNDVNFGPSPWRKMLVALAVVLLIVAGAAVAIVAAPTWAGASTAAAPPPPPAAPQSACLVADTAGGSPCTQAVEVQKSGTICFMPPSGYTGSATCTWHITCGLNIEPAFTITQMDTEAQYDTVTIFSGADANGQRLAQLSGSLADQQQLSFDGDASRGLTIVFASDTGQSAEGFAGSYSCYDRCLHPFVDCGAHGECRHGAGAHAGVCICDEGYEGERCEVLLDPCAGVDCGSHGSCSGGRCSCSGGYSGSSCETDPCAHVSCGNHGSCSGGRCSCRDGYSGSSCQTAPDACEYPHHLSCGSHGSCSGGRCSCSGGYSGSSCQTAPNRCEYPRHVSCGSHGSCSNGACTCADRYSGSRCEQIPCCTTACGSSCGSGHDYCGHDCGTCGGSSRSYCDAHYQGWDAACDREC